MSSKRTIVHARGSLQRIAVFLVRSLNSFLEWLFASKNPAIVHVREAIRANRVLLFCARSLISGVHLLPRLQQIFRAKFSKVARRLDAIMVARMAGGSVTVPELEQIWSRSRRGSRVLVLADGPEREQVEAVLKAARAKVRFCSGPAPQGTEVIDFDSLDLIVVGPGDSQAAEFPERGVEKLLRVGSGRRSDYLAAARSDPAGRADPADQSGGRLQKEIAEGKRRRVLFLNDVGFQYGAGIALKRQVASLLLKGFEVAVVAWLPGKLLEAPEVVGIRHFAGWLGVHDIGASRRRERTEKENVAEILARIQSLGPDVIITGNLHGTGFPLPLSASLQRLDVVVVSYMHDCFWATGRCAYPCSCQLYRSGCDETCPTADDYPALAREKIRPAWEAKTRIFEGASGIALATNSKWTKEIAIDRFGKRARIDRVPLAVDHELFAPIPKAVARRLLDLPSEGLFVVMGAVDILNKWKGGDLFVQLLERLRMRNDLSVLLFGQSSALLKSTRSFGLVPDERLMPFILNSADIFVGTATEEAFGQTLLEASACGLPVVAFDRGGISDVVLDGQTGRLVKELDVDEMYAVIDQLLVDTSQRERLGKKARQRVESEFTLISQADAWIDYLDNRSGAPA
jgi:glycosyltransferase involved in cell wall biosynthesis